MNKKRHEHGIAIVGMAGVFPKSRDIRVFWERILAEHDVFEDVPASRWEPGDHYNPDTAASDKTYSMRGGFIPDLDFDPVEFGIPPMSLESIDTAQLVALVVARDALRDAGYGESRTWNKQGTGVILGVSGTTMKLQAPLRSRMDFPLWEKIMRASGVDDSQIEDVLERAGESFVGWTEDSFPGMLANLVAGRIANRLDLGALNCTVDAACASGLCAIKFACDSLRSGDCDMVVTGGIDLDNSIQAYMSFAKTSVLSKTGAVRAFDEGADGTMISEAAAMLVLKREEDALRDQDRIYAVIRGVGASSDGKSESIYSPKSEGQSRAIAEAYERSGISPSSVGLVEAHATGTTVGDAVEFKSLNDVFQAGGAGRQSVALGSIKSQFGHTKAAAGAVSLIKVVLALHHKVLPPTLNLAKPNPKLAHENSAFYFNSHARPWIQPLGGSSRLGGVSASGFGGVNYHVVVEEASPEHSDPYRLSSTPLIGLISAPSLEELKRTCRDLRREIEEGGDQQALLQAKGVAVCRDHPRVAFVVPTGEGALPYLQTVEEMLLRAPDAESLHDPSGVWYRRESVQGKVAAVFPGQGTQYVDMGLDLANDYPEYRRLLALADQVFAASGHEPISSAVFPVPVAGSSNTDREQRLRRTLYAQSSVAILSVATWKLLREMGFAADCGVGHSLGELSALWAAGALGDAEAIALIKTRGEAFSPPGDGTPTGEMTAIMDSLEAVQAVLDLSPGVHLANVNGPGQVVVGGLPAALDEFESELARKQLAFARLPVSAAFHTPLVRYGLDTWSKALGSTDFAEPAWPICSNTTADWHDSKSEGIRELLYRHPAEPVQFRSCVGRLYEDGVRIFVEIGPRGTLGRLVDQSLGDLPHVTVSTNGEKKGSSTLQLARAVAQLLAVGLPLDPSDRYAVPVMATKAKPNGISVKLGGDNYLRAGTKERMQQAVTPRSACQTTHPASRTNGTLNKPAEGRPLEMTRSSTPPTDLSQDLARTVVEFESAALETHREFLRAQAEQARALAEMIRSRAASDSVQKLVSFQEESLKVHRDYLETQGNLGACLSELIGGSGSIEYRRPVAPPPLVEPPRASLVREASVELAPVVERAEVGPAEPPRAVVEAAPKEVSLAERILAVVSEKTGYPPSVIDLDSDLEADLGIDSIKRIEILSSFAGSGEVNRSQLGNLRTLRQIIEQLEGGAKPAEPQSLALEGEYVQAVEIGAPGFRGSGFAPQGVTVVVGDRSGLADEVVALLERREYLTATLLPSQSTEFAIQASLADIALNVGPIGACVYLQDAEGPLASRNLLFGLMLAKGLSEHFEGSVQCAFLAATSVDGRLGHGGDIDFDPAAGGVFGLVKTLRQEWPNTLCRAIDVDPRLDAQRQASLIVDEFLGIDQGPIEVGVQEGRRVTLASMPSNPPTPRDDLNRPMTFLVTGGARGVTAKCVEAMAAQRPNSRFILLGRTNVDQTEASWTAGCKDRAELRQRVLEKMRTDGSPVVPKQVESQIEAVLQAREVRATVATVRSLGSTVEYHALDISDDAAMSSLISGIEVVDGLIHGAGVIADSRVARKTPEEFERVFRPKVDGLDNVLRRLDESKLRVIVLFSSTASIYGNVGQADYAMANEILNKKALLLRRRLPSCRTVSICWGPWDGGMVTSDIADRFRDKGVGMISLRDGAAFLVQEAFREINAPSQVIFGDGPDMAGAALDAAAKGEPDRVVVP